uniref:Uncharacterized protein n=1 Tax=Timema douglasi TaxID=61478 RepID=A0A7R8ZA75_TIMDO|nr:unnamed protein product [Timema douglasi]
MGKREKCHAHHATPPQSISYAFSLGARTMYAGRDVVDETSHTETEKRGSFGGLSFGPSNRLSPSRDVLGRGVTLSSFIAYYLELAGKAKVVSHLTQCMGSLDHTILTTPKLPQKNCVDFRSQQLDRILPILLDMVVAFGLLRKKRRDDLTQ